MSFQLKCIVCLESTVLVDPRSELPFCCDAHSLLYDKKKMSVGGYDGNSNIDIREKVSELRIIFKFLVDNYVHAENQDARWDAKDYLGQLINVVEFEIGSNRARMGGYGMFKNDLETILLHEVNYELALEKILTVVRMIIHNMDTIHNSLTELLVAVTHEKKLIDDVLDS